MSQEGTPSHPGALHEARACFDSGDYARALELIVGMPVNLRDAETVAALARDCYLRMGEISRALGEVSRLRRCKDSAARRRQARFLLGRLRETDSSWLPSLPDARVPKEPDKRVVLHLLKESLPYAQTGFTFRSRMTLEAQRRAGMEPIVVTSLGFPASSGIVDAPSPAEVEGIRHHRLHARSALPLPIKKLPYDILLTEQAAQTANIVKQERPSLIQAGSGFRGFDQALVGLALSRQYDIPFVYEVRGFLEATWTSRTDLQEHGEYYERRRAQEERCMSEADLVITIGESMASELEHRGVDPTKLCVVPNAVDIERFVPRPANRDLSRRLGLGDRFVVGYVSNLGKREGIQYLIRATAHLASQGRDIACLIVGDGPERQSLEQLRIDLGGDTPVVMTGHVPNDDVENYYALVDLFVVPRVDDHAARYVTPLKPLEAMAMGIPVIASDLPALREIVSPGKRGQVFPAGDVDGLASTIAELMDNGELRKSLASSAFDWVVKDRTIEANVERYRAALASVLP